MRRSVELTSLEAAACLPALHLPQPRVALGIALRGLATSAIDISDGLLADLGHILERSGVAAEIEYQQIPLSQTMRMHLQDEPAKNCILAGGDDYELCFTVPATRHADILALSKSLDLPLTCIGIIGAGAGLTVLEAGQPITITVTGFDHFA